MVQQGMGGEGGLGNEALISATTPNPGQEHFPGSLIPVQSRRIPPSSCPCSVLCSTQHLSEEVSQFAPVVSPSIQY